MTFKDWNASKALAHIAKAPGFSIKPCTSSSISSAEAALFKAVVAEKTASSLKKRQQVEVREEVSAGLTSTMSQIAKKPRGPAPVFGSGKTMTQQNAPAMLIQQNDVDLTTHIGNFFHANGLDFALVDTFAFNPLIYKKKSPPLGNGGGADATVKSFSARRFEPIPLRKIESDECRPGCHLYFCEKIKFAS
jgi:hypothetical protein